MKKLFGRDKPKITKTTPLEQEPVNTPIHAQHAVFHEDKWEIVNSDLESPYATPNIPSRSSSFNSLPPGASPPQPSPNPPRAGSPYSQPQSKSSPRDQFRETHLPVLKKRNQPPPTVAALGMLRALDPHSDHAVNRQRSSSEERVQYSDTSHRDKEEKKDKRGFWSRDKDKLFERGRSDREDQDEITRMIGYLTLTASEEWRLVLDVCDKASASEQNAKDAVRALRREFKYGEPPTQLSAARLWAIMLRNSSEVFISQSTSRKFLDTLEDVVTSSKTSPVVKARILDVVAAAAYASGTKKDTGFKGLWRKVKPPGAPDEGIPFDTDDAMFNPSLPPAHDRHNSPSPVSKSKDREHRHRRKRKSPGSRNQIIPPDEDMRRLFQECKIGQGNASLLSQALATATPEELKRDIIKEFYAKCRASQELIYAQIDWASAGAERSRLQQQEFRERNRKTSDVSLITNNNSIDDPPLELTVEEQLLAALLAANGELMEALKLYEDLERVAVERMAEDISRKETRMDPRDAVMYRRFHSAISGGPSRSPSPAGPRSRPSSTLLHPTPTHADELVQSLAPPPAAPLGPRSPAYVSRTPSPGSGPLGHHRNPSAETRSIEYNTSRNVPPLPHPPPHLETVGVPSSSSYANDTIQTPLYPSDKALGKRRAPVQEEEVQARNSDSEDYFLEIPGEYNDHSNHSDSDSDSDSRWGGMPRKHHQEFVYDAAAERTAQRLREGHAILVNGVH